VTHATLSALEQSSVGAAGAMGSGHTRQRVAWAVAFQQSRAEPLAQRKAGIRVTACDSGDVTRLQQSSVGASGAQWKAGTRELCVPGGAACAQAERRWRLWRDGKQAHVTACDPGGAACAQAEQRRRIWRNEKRAHVTACDSADAAVGGDRDDGRSVLVCVEQLAPVPEPRGDARPRGPNALRLVDEKGHALQLKRRAPQWSPRVQELYVLGREHAAEHETDVEDGLRGGICATRVVCERRSNSQPRRGSARHQPLRRMNEQP
jgi:hypothetical protein